MKHPIDLPDLYDPKSPMGAEIYVNYKTKLKAMKNETRWQIIACLMAFAFVTVPFWAWW